MATTIEWNVVAPHMKEAIQDEDGKGIADPMLCLRGVVTTDADEVTFDVYTPFISGRLERVVVIPDHTPGMIPGLGGVLSIEMFQHYMDAPCTLQAGAYPEQLDLLNGLGLAVLNNQITHLVVPDIADPVVRHSIHPQLLVQDSLQLHFTGWSNGAVADRRCWVYLYFTQATSGNAGGPGGAQDVEFVQLLATANVTISNANPVGNVNLTFAPVTGRAKIKRVVVVRTASAGATPYNPKSRTFELFDVNVASVPASDGINTLHFEEELEPSAGGRLINKTDHMLGEILFRNVDLTQYGIMSARITAGGGAAGTTETYNIQVYGESMD